MDSSLFLNTRTELCLGREANTYGVDWENLTAPTRPLHCRPEHVCHAEGCRSEAPERLRSTIQGQPYAASGLYIHYSD